MIITIRGLEIELLAQKAIFLPQERILVVADMHLGKLAHFRKAGIFVPDQSENEDLLVLQSLIEAHGPAEVVFLGDLFHSEKNSSHQSFLVLLNRFPDVKYTLTKGNHDIIPKSFFQDASVEIVEKRDLDNDIVLRHQLPARPLDNEFYIIGHIHPGYLVSGRGRQFFRLPCFHQNENTLVLPAFGRHTGLFIPEPSAANKNYVIMNNDIVLMKRS